MAEKTLLAIGLDRGLRISRRFRTAEQHWVEV
jgi:hypothetical protein